MVKKLASTLPWVKQALHNLLQGNKTRGDHQVASIYLIVVIPHIKLHLNIIRVTEADVFFLPIRVKFNACCGNAKLCQSHQQLFQLFALIDGESKVVKPNSVFAASTIFRQMSIE